MKVNVRVMNLFLGLMRSCGTMWTCLLNFMTRLKPRLRGLPARLRPKVLLDKVDKVFASKSDLPHSLNTSLYKVKSEEGEISVPNPDLAKHKGTFSI